MFHMPPKSQVGSSENLPSTNSAPRSYQPKTQPLSHEGHRATAARLGTSAEATIGCVLRVFVVKQKNISATMRRNMLAGSGTACRPDRLPEPGVSCERT